LYGGDKKYAAAQGVIQMKTQDRLKRLFKLRFAVLYPFVVFAIFFANCSDKSIPAEPGMAGKPGHFQNNKAKNHIKRLFFRRFWQNLSS